MSKKKNSRPQRQAVPKKEDDTPKIPKIFPCGWISPEGKLYPALPKEQEQIADALCREFLGLSIPVPGEHLLDNGWVQIRPEEQPVFRIWPTDEQFDVMKEYRLTTATAQNECIFKVLNRKKSLDIFFRKDNYRAEEWYGEFLIFNSIGVCCVPDEQVFEIREALARFGFDAYTTKHESAQTGHTYIVGGTKKQEE